MEILKRKEAKARKLQRYFTGKPCKHGHLCERRTSSGQCQECYKAGLRKWRAKNRQKVSAYNKEYREKNKEDLVRKAREEYFQNRDEHLERCQQWRRNNKEHLRAYGKSHRENNRGYYYQRNSMRRAKKLQRSLVGFEEDIKVIYQQALEMRLNGRDVHVDHIVPLQGDIVSGLHVPWNLQILEAKENLSKNNRFDPTVEVFN